MVETLVHIHVVPNPDTVEHTASPECVCGPTLDEPEPDDEAPEVPCWRHHALDPDTAAAISEAMSEDDD